MLSRARPRNDETALGQAVSCDYSGLAESPLCRHKISLIRAFVHERPGVLYMHAPGLGDAHEHPLDLGHVEGTETVKAVSDDTAVPDEGDGVEDHQLHEASQVGV